jgi:hypothetical protein
MSLGDLFQTIEGQKDSYGISNWGITNASTCANLDPADRVMLHHHACFI